MHLGALFSVVNVLIFITAEGNCDSVEDDYVDWAPPGGCSSSADCDGQECCSSDGSNTSCRPLAQIGQPCSGATPTNSDVPPRYCPCKKGFTCKDIGDGYSICAA